MNEINLTDTEYMELCRFAADKFEYICPINEYSDERQEAIRNFITTYIDGGKFVVYNSRNQFLADFDTLDDAIHYKEENEPKNELFSIECEILN